MARNIFVLAEEGGGGEGGVVGRATGTAVWCGGDSFFRTLSLLIFFFMRRGSRTLAARLFHLAPSTTTVTASRSAWPQSIPPLSWCPPSLRRTKMATATVPAPATTAAANGADARQARTTVGACLGMHARLAPLSPAGSNAPGWECVAGEKWGCDRAIVGVPHLRSWPLRAPVDRTRKRLACALERIGEVPYCFLFLTRTPTQHNTPSLPAQAFLTVYEKLRDDLVDDGLLGDQPAFAKAYMKEVSAKEEMGGGGGERRADAAPVAHGAITPSFPQAASSRTARHNPHAPTHRCSTSTCPAAS